MGTMTAPRVATDHRAAITELVENLLTETIFAWVDGELGGNDQQDRPETSLALAFVNAIAERNGPVAHMARNAIANALAAGYWLGQGRQRQPARTARPCTARRANRAVRLQAREVPAMTIALTQRLLRGLVFARIFLATHPDTIREGREELGFGGDLFGSCSQGQHAWRDGVCKWCGAEVGA